MSVRNGVKKDTKDTKKEAIKVEEKGRGGVECAEVLKTLTVKEAPPLSPNKLLHAVFDFLPNDLLLFFLSNALETTVRCHQMDLKKC